MRFGNADGLTFIELLISLGIASVIVTTTLSSTTMAFLTARRSDLRHELAMDFLLLNEYFSREIPNTGGMSLPIAASLFVENDCKARGDFPSCGSTDRVSVVYPTKPAACRVTSVAGPLLDVEKGESCCLVDASVDKSQVMLVKNGVYGQRFVASSDPAVCQVRIVDGPLTGNDNAPAGFDWTGAEILPIRVRTYYLQNPEGELVRYTYDTGGEPNSGKAEIVADRVLDFQISLGFDFAPADGSITDLENTSDEWLYNASTSSEVAGQGKFSNVPASLMRMVAIGLVIGAPDSSGLAQKKAKVLDGPDRLREGWAVHSGVSKFALRNVYLFQ